MFLCVFCCVVFAMVLLQGALSFLLIAHRKIAYYFNGCVVWKTKDCGNVLLVVSVVFVMCMVGGSVLCHVLYFSGILSVYVGYYVWFWDGIEYSDLL